jgi:pyruvate kinase
LPKGRSSSITYDKLIEEVPENAAILLDDGRVEMKVEKVDLAAQELHCRTIVGGTLSNSKGVNFPGVCLSIKALTDKDRQDLLFGLDRGVDWVALSFVRNPDDIREIKEIIAGAGKNTPVIAKIEKHEAIEQMEEILSICDGVMVARGDLGVELPAEDVPILQKELIRTANRLGIPIITATQMLDSMEKNPRATRAEISDVANAIIDGTDAVMLSGETATGKYPIEAVKTMVRIAVRTEKLKLNRELKTDRTSIPNAICEAITRVAGQLNAAAIVPLTQTGYTGRNVSKFRPSQPIITVTPHVAVARQLQVVWGVKPLVMLNSGTPEEIFEAVISRARLDNLLDDGDLVVFTSGTQGVTGSTDLIKVKVVTALVAQGVGLGEQFITGAACIVNTPRDLANFRPGDIIVARSTSKEYIEAMKKARGVIVEDPSFQCHAASVCPQLEIPVIIGVRDAINKIRDSAAITLDVKRGSIYAGTIDRPLS